MASRIMLVDDHPMVRKGVERLISGNADMEVVGQAENGQIAVERAAELNPDVIIMDVSMPVMDGIEATRLIKSESPDIQVIALSAHDDRASIAAMADAGASGYVSKYDLFDDLIGAIEKVLQDDTLAVTSVGQ